MIRARLFLCGVLAVFPCDAFARVFAPEVFTLANGLRIVVVRNDLSEAFAQMLWFSAGAADDPAGKEGVAHYLEHMMFKDTQKLEAGDFSAHIALRAGKDNAFTRQDATAYHVTLGTEWLGLALALEAERMHALFIDAAKAETERGVILNEREERTQSDPAALFHERFAKAFWGAQHPYSRPVIGEKETVSIITAQDLRSFYARFYAPRNAVLVVCGNVQTADVLRLADGTFGRIPSGDARRSVVLPAPLSKPFTQAFSMRDTRVRQPFFIKKTLAPSLRDDARRAAALEVLAETLGGGEVGLLYRAFVMGTTGQASALDVYYDDTTRGPAAFSVAGTPVPGGDPHALAKDVEAYLRFLRRKGFSGTDVGAAKKRLLADAVFVQDDFMAPAHVLGKALAAGYGLDAVEEWPARIARVRARDVTAALEMILEEKHTLTGFLLTQESAP